MSSYKAEVVIVGAGLAGIVATLEVLDRGKKVILIDRDTEENVGGLARLSFGGIFIVGTPEQKKSGVTDSPSLAYSDWCSCAEFGKNDTYPKQWASYYTENSLDGIYHYLRGKGVQFFPVVHWVERGMFRPGNSVPRFHMVWGTGHGLIESLKKALYSHKNFANLQLLFGCQILEIQKKGSRVTGVSGIFTDGKKISAEGEHIVLASGGICGDIQKVKKNWYKSWGKPPEIILNGSHKYADGKLMEQAARHKAVVTHLDKQWNYAAGVHHPRPHFEGHGLSLVPPKSALWMDARGKRIGPVPLMTAFDTRFLVEQICKTEHKYSWQVLNHKIAVKELAVSGSEYNDAIRDKKYLAFILQVLLGNKQLVKDLSENCIDFVTGGTVSELAEKMNRLNGNNLVDGKLLEAEILYYDSMIERGEKFHNDDQLRRIAQVRKYRGDRVRTCKFQKILDPKAGPLIAIREFILSRKSLGGIQTNLSSEVLGSGEKPIPGLYAIGEAAGFGGGGIHGIGALEGTFLGSCILTARAFARKFD